MGITEILARFAVETPVGFMSEAMKDSARMKFLDTIGIMVAGARHPSGKIAISLARKLGGKNRQRFAARHPRPPWSLQLSPTGSVHTRLNMTTTRAELATPAYASCPDASPLRRLKVKAVSPCWKRSGGVRDFV